MKNMASTLKHEGLKSSQDSKESKMKATIYNYDSKKPFIQVAEKEKISVKTKTAMNS